jgi:peptidoglycan hydrolase-like protein with peptidoglycan-binding domain
LAGVTPAAEEATTTGLVTWLPEANSTIANGGVLYRVDNAPVVLLEGAATLYRDLSSGDTGADVKALEAALAALGHGGDMTVDTTFTSATAAALEDFQESVGIDVTGTLDLTTVVMHDGPVVVSTLAAAVGDAATSGLEILVVADPQRDVTLALDPSEITSIAVGDVVSVTLLDGSRADASVSSMSAAPADDGTYTLVARLDPAAEVVGDHLTVTVSAPRLLAEDALLIDPFALVLLESNRTVVRVVRGEDVVDVEVTVIATAGRVTAVESDELAEGDMMES